MQLTKSEQGIRAWHERIYFLIWNDVDNFYNHKFQSTDILIYMPVQLRNTG